MGVQRTKTRKIEVKVEGQGINNIDKIGQPFAATHRSKKKRLRARKRGGKGRKRTVPTGINRDYLR